MAEREADDPADVESLSVLIIDDDEVERRMVRRALERGEWALDVVEAATGQDGLARAAEDGFDAILLDYQLPDVDGIAVLQTLRQRGVDVPVIALTGKGTEEVAVQFLKSGADDYVAKDDLGGHRLVHALANQVRIHRLLRDVPRSGPAGGADGDGFLVQERNALVGVLSSTALEGFEAGVEDLTRLSGTFQGLLDRLDEDPEEAERALRDLQREWALSVGSIRDLSTTLRTLRRLLVAGPALEPVDVDPVVGRLLDGFERTAPSRVRFERELSGPPTVSLDPTALRQVLLHLLNNAVEAIPEAGRVTVRTRGDDAGGVVIEVENTGPPLPDDLGHRAFDLFVTTKEDHEGLGLALVRHLTQAMGGTVVHRNLSGPGGEGAGGAEGGERGEDAGDGEGVVFILRFPGTADADGAADADAAS